MKLQKSLSGRWPKASLVLLTTLVRDFEAHSPRLSSSSSEEGMITFILRIFTNSLRIAGEGDSNLASEAVAIAIWALTKNIFGWRRWDVDHYEKYLKASLVLLERLVEEDSKYDFLKLSSSDTLTVSQTMKSFLIKVMPLKSSMLTSNYFHHSLEFCNFHLCPEPVGVLVEQ